MKVFELLAGLEHERGGRAVGAVSLAGAHQSPFGLAARRADRRGLGRAGFGALREVVRDLRITTSVSSMHIWPHPVLQDTFPFETRASFEI